MNNYLVVSVSYTGHTQEFVSVASSLEACARRILGTKTLSMSDATVEYDTATKRSYTTSATFVTDAQTTIIIKEVK